MARTEAMWLTIGLLAAALFTCPSFAQAADVLVLTRDWTPTTCSNEAAGCAASYPDTFRVASLGVASDTSPELRQGCTGGGGLKSSDLDKSDYTRDQLGCAWQNATDGLKSLQNSWKESWADYGKCTPAKSAVAYLELGLELDQGFPLPNDLPASVDYIQLLQALKAGFGQEGYVLCDSKKQLQSISLCFQPDLGEGGPKLISCPWAAPASCAGLLLVPRGEQGPTCVDYYKASPVLLSAAPGPAPAMAPAPAPAKQPAVAPAKQPAAAPATQPAKSPSGTASSPPEEAVSPPPAEKEPEQAPSDSSGSSGDSAGTGSASIAPAPAPSDDAAAAAASANTAGTAAVDPSSGSGGSSGISTGVKIGALVAGIAGGVVIGGAAFGGGWWFYQRRRRRGQAVVSSPGGGSGPFPDPEKGCLASSAESLSSWSDSDGAAKRLDSRSSGTSSRARGAGAAAAAAAGSPPSMKRSHSHGSGLPRAHRHASSNGSASPPEATPPRHPESVRSMRSVSSRRSDGGLLRSDTGGLPGVDSGGGSLRRMDSSGGASAKYVQPGSLPPSGISPWASPARGTSLSSSNSGTGSLAQDLEVALSGGSTSSLRRSISDVGGAAAEAPGALHRTLSGSPSKAPSGRYVPGPPIKPIKYVQPAAPTRSPSKGAGSSKLPSVNE